MAYDSSSAVHGHQSLQIMAYSHSPPFSREDPQQASTAVNKKAAAKTVQSADMKVWSFGHADRMRKRRLFSYKIYTAEGHIKASLHNTFRFIKSKYFAMRYGC